MKREKEPPTLNGLLTAVDELIQFKEMYSKEPTSENRGYVRMAEVSVLQMAESFYNRHWEKVV